LRKGLRGAAVRPFLRAAKVTPRGCSRPLQRRIADFGAERSGRSAVCALAEHYSIEVPLYTVDAVTRRVAKEAHTFNLERPPGEKPAATQVTEIDGSMVPTVGFKGVGEVSDPAKKADRRRRRTCQWNEIRVCSTHDIGRADARYGASFGGVLEAGLMMRMNCVQCGMDENTHIHGVGDGATWIAGQYEKQFGTQSRFLLDFYHLCEYLAAASGSCAASETPAEKQRWMERQKEWLKLNRHQQVLRNLERHVEAPDVTEENAPVRRCLRYIRNRDDQLDYRGALEKDLPIGSGEVESAHRHLIQRRLKLPGAWWLKQTASDIAQLRVTRANHQWGSFWEKKAA
jgi:hypothetical protein